MNSIIAYESSNTSEDEMQEDLGNAAGNWHTFTFVNLSIDEEFVKEIITIMSNHENLVEIKDKHISCSKTIVLKSFQIDKFLDGMQTVCKNNSRFTVSFDRFTTFKSPKNLFISLLVANGSSQLATLTGEINLLLKTFHQKAYWSGPKFHASIAYSSDCELDLAPLKDLQEKMNGLRMVVDVVRCKIGNRLYSWDLA